MRTDAQLAFIPIGSPLSLVAGAGVGVPSGVIDLLGQGAGTAPQNVIGNVILFGAPDAMGVGHLRPELNVTIGTAFTTGNSATLNVALQAAADLGTPTYQPSTWNTLIETGPIAVANLTANTVIARFPWVPPFPANLRPRYLRLNFAVAAATNFTAGTIGSALVTIVRDDEFQKYGAKNFSVA